VTPTVKQNISKMVMSLPFRRLDGATRRRYVPHHDSDSHRMITHSSSSIEGASWARGQPSSVTSDRHTIRRGSFRRRCARSPWWGTQILPGSRLPHRDYISFPESFTGRFRDLHAFAIVDKSYGMSRTIISLIRDGNCVQEAFHSIQGKHTATSCAFHD
jgi:hypothetical protein